MQGLIIAKYGKTGGKLTRIFQLSSQVTIFGT
jgi:hypothetical protein